MKLLRIFVYVVLMIPRELWLLLVSPITVFLPLLFAIALWAVYGNYEIAEVTKLEYLMAIPFYTTIKTVRQIWRS